MRDVGGIRGMISMLVCEHTFIAHAHPTPGFLLKARSAQLNFGQISASCFPRISHRG